MAVLSCASLSKTDSPIEQPIITTKHAHSPSNVDVVHKAPKFQTLVEVLQCELGRPGKSSVNLDGFEPTKDWTPLHYAVLYKREAALLHFLRNGQTPDGASHVQSPLCIAVAAGHVEAVKMLCESGANVDVLCTHSGETPLHLAIKTASDDILDILLRHNPDLNARALYTGETPLHFAAARSGSDHAVSALLKHGADYGLLDSKGLSPAEVALQKQELQHAVAIIGTAGTNSHKLAKEKHMLFAQVIERRDQSSMNKTLVAKVLEIAHPSDSTALVEAIKTQDANLVAIILERGADPNQSTTSGLYPLFAAFNARSASVVQTLVEHGADVTLRNPHGPNVLQAALASPLACDKNAITKVFSLLLAHGADPFTIYPDGTTLVHHVVRPGLELSEIAELLLQRGIKVDAEDRNGDTALHVAATAPACVAILLKHGANPNAINGKGLTPLLCALNSAMTNNEPDLRHLVKVSDLGKVGTTGKGAMHLAAQKGWTKNIRLLLENGVDTTVVDLKKRTPLILAVLHQRWEAISLLATKPGMNAWDESGLTALHHIAICTPKEPTTWKQIAATAALFCGKGVSRTMRDGSGSTPLILGIKTLPEEGLLVIKAFLFQNGPDRSNCIAHEDHDQHNALYYAATMGKAAFVEVLLRHGTPFALNEWAKKRTVNQRILRLFAEHEWLRRVARLHRQSNTPQNESLLPKILPIPLLNDVLAMGLDPNLLPQAKPASSLLCTLLEHGVSSPLARPNYMYDALRLALKFGADPNHVANRKPHSAVKARSSQQAPLGVRLLAFLIEQYPLADVPMVKLLCDHGAALSDPSPLYDGRYPLHSAVQVNSADVVGEILRRKADVDCVDSRHRTPLYIACEKGHSDIVRLLLRAGSKPNARDCEGNTPLHASVAAGHDEVIPLLLRSGAKPDLQNQKGLTSLRSLPDKLPERRKEEIARMLQQGRQAPERVIHQHEAPLQPVQTTSIEVKPPAAKAGRNTLKKLRNAPAPPPEITPRPPDAHQFALQAPIVLPLSKTPPSLPRTSYQTSNSPRKPLIPRSPQAPPKVQHNLAALTPAPTTAQIHALAPAPAPAFTQAPIPAPASNLTLNTRNQPVEARIDSGFDLSKSLENKPLPVPNKKRGSYDMLADWPTEGDELKTWLIVSRMTDRL